MPEDHDHHWELAHADIYKCQICDLELNQPEIELLPKPVKPVSYKVVYELLGRTSGGMKAISVVEISGQRQGHTATQTVLSYKQIESLRKMGMIRS
jgi:hypothetical protein